MQAEIRSYGRVTLRFSQCLTAINCKYAKDGTVDYIGSDHGSFLLAEKEKGNKDIFTAAAGSACRNDAATDADGCISMAS